MNYMLHLRDHLDNIIISTNAITHDSLNLGEDPAFHYVQGDIDKEKVDATYLRKKANILKGKSFEISKLVCFAKRDVTSLEVLTRSL